MLIAVLKEIQIMSQSLVELVDKGSFIVAIAAATLSLIALPASSFIKNKVDVKILEKEYNEVAKDIKTTINYIKAEDPNIIDLMLKNVTELREYYVISKRQAVRAFSATLIACVLGFVIYILGIIVSIDSSNGGMIYSTIAGSVVEIIAGLFFWLYSRTTQQLSIYHERLGKTEKYLSAIQLIEKITDSNKDAAYKLIIESMLNDNLTKK